MNIAPREKLLGDELTLQQKGSLGGRLEHTRVDPDGKGNARFANADKTNDFTAGSLSSGAVYTLTPIWSLAATLGYTERAPTFYELYANGAHVATGTYELGNANLKKEKAVSSDLALRFDNGTHKGSFGVFYGQLGTGRTLNNDGEANAGGIPEYEYSGVRARFAGVEAQDHWKLGEGAYGKFALELSGDYTRATNLDTGEALPRIAPLRLDSGLLWEPDRWGENLTNQTVRYASSILRDIAPGPRQKRASGPTHHLLDNSANPLGGGHLRPPPLVPPRQAVTVTQSEMMHLAICAFSQRRGALSLAAIT